MHIEILHKILFICLNANYFCKLEKTKFQINSIQNATLFYKNVTFLQTFMLQLKNFRQPCSYSEIKDKIYIYIYSLVKFKKL